MSYYALSFFLKVSKGQPNSLLLYFRIKGVMYDEIFIAEHLHVYVLPDNEMSQLIDSDLEVMEGAFPHESFSVP